MKFLRLQDISPLVRRIAMDRHSPVSCSLRRQCSAHLTNLLLRCVDGECIHELRQLRLADRPSFISVDEVEDLEVETRQHKNEQERLSASKPTR